MEIYRSFFEHMFDAAFLVDAACTIENVNQAAEALTGYDRDRLIGQPLAMLLPPNVASEHADYVMDYLGRGGVSNVLQKARQFSIVDAAGDELPIELKAFEMADVGEEVRFGAMMRDMREQLRLRKDREAMFDRLARLALTDELTNLPNRRAFMEVLDRELAQAARDGHPASVAVVDIDHFKRVNDTYGHAAGDQVLRQVGESFTANLRGGDTVGRLGGEEFGILLPRDGLDVALAVLERLAASLRATPMQIGGAEPIYVTVSAGIAKLDGDGSSRDALEAADRAMYRAKIMGRDRVAVSERS